MKDIHLTSRETDRKAMTALRKVMFGALALAIPALIGVCIKPPFLPIEHLRLFDAALCASLAVLVWAVFHICGLHRLSGRKALIMVIFAVLLWALLVITLLVVSRLNLDHDWDREQEIMKGHKADRVDQRIFSLLIVTWHRL
jgi:hypothetical protein